MRVFSGSLATETNTFAPMPTGLASFRDRGYYAAGTAPGAAELLRRPAACGAPARPAQGWTLIEGMVAAAQPSGTTTRARLRDAARRAARPTCARAAGRHGAARPARRDGRRRLRRLRGRPAAARARDRRPRRWWSAPSSIRTTTSRRRCSTNADMLISFKEYPHTDVARARLRAGRPVRGQPRRGESGRSAAVGRLRDARSRSTPRASRRARSSNASRRWKARTASCRSRSRTASPGATCRTWAPRCWSMPTATPPRRSALARQLADELIGHARQRSACAARHRRRARRSAGFRRRPGGAGRRRRQSRRRRGRRFDLHPAPHGGARHRQRLPRPALGSGRGAHRLRSRRRRAPARCASAARSAPLSGDADRPGGAPSKALHARHDADAACRTAPTAMGDCALVATNGIEIVLITLRNQAMGTDLFTSSAATSRRRRSSS